MDFCQVGVTYQMNLNPSRLVAYVQAGNLVQGGGVRVNNKKISDVEYRLAKEDLIDGRLVLLAAGKKNKLLLHVE